MRTCIAIFLLAVGSLNAQMFEIGGFFGGSNTIGDVGNTTYVLPEGLTVGALFKWNISKRYSWRASIIRSNLIFDDLESNLQSRVQRGFDFHNSITEYSVGLEFNFVDFDLSKTGNPFTPYLYTGLTYFRYDYDYIRPNSGEQIKGVRDGALAVPMTLGVKYRLNEFLVIGGEVGARYALTDNLDGSNPIDLDNNGSVVNEDISDAIFGNIFSDDWYVFSGITITYTFGRKPCQECYE